jgi:hypothetical protein
MVLFTFNYNGVRKRLQFPYCLHQRLNSQDLTKILKIKKKQYFIFFRGARVCWPLLYLYRPFRIFDLCLNSNPESCVARRRATN